MMEHLFEPFFTTKEVGKGTGLGLSAIYGSIRDHGGIIQVKSEEKKGSVFHLYYPVVDDLILYGDEESTAETNGSKTILLVEDEEILRTIAKRMLEGMGHKVITASDGIEGVERYRENCRNIDLVIMDLVMPHMNGHDAFLEMKKVGFNLRVVFSSGFSKDRTTENLLKDPSVKGFVPKPYRRSELKEIISMVFPSN